MITVTPVQDQALTEFEFTYKVIGTESLSFTRVMMNAFSDVRLLIPLAIIIVLVCCICYCIKLCTQYQGKIEDEEGEIPQSAVELVDEPSDRKASFSKKDIE